MAEQDPWLLEVRDEAGAVRRVPLDDPPYLIGRSGDADIRLDRQTVSRRHARLTRDGDGRWWIEDLGSRGGILVNGQRVTEAELTGRDRLAISRFELRLVDPARGRSRSPSSVAWAESTSDPQISVLTHVTPPKLDTSHIAAVNDLGRELLDTADPADRLQRLCDAVCGPTVKARWAMALAVDAEDPSRPADQLALAPDDDAETEERHLSRTVIRAMQSSGAPVLANNYDPSDGAIEMSIIGQGPATAVVACPLGDADAGRRLLYVTLPPALGSIEWLALIALAAKAYDQAEASWAARAAAQARAVIERDMENARRIQESILPKPYDAAEADIAWHFEPCDAVGGDVVDVVPLGDGRVLLVVADVTGHGLPAALTALSVHSIIHTCARTAMPLAELAAALNDHLSNYLPDGRFVTGVVIALDPATGTMEYLNAGHPPPLIRTADGNTRTMPTAGQMPLGILPCEYQPVNESLGPGEVLFISTDGLTELRVDQGDMLATEGVAELLAGVLDGSTGPIADAVPAITSALDDRRADAHRLDDETFLLVRRP